MVKPVVAVGGLAVLIGISFWPQSPIRRAALNAGGKPNDPKIHGELAREAAKVYDYKLAEREFNLGQDQKVLGARDEVFPEEAIEQQITDWENVAKTVNSRDLWLKLAELYWRVFDEEKAREAWQKAWLIDPNYEGVISLQRVILPEELQ